MPIVTTLPDWDGGAIQVTYEPNSTPASLLASESMDALITSAEGGLGPLPSDFLSRELEIPKRKILEYAGQISSRAEVTMVALHSRKRGGKLRGAILVPFGTADCYKRHVVPEHRGLPWRDFYYNITFESIAYACQYWQATKLVTNHLSGCGQKFHLHIPGCQYEALAHFAQDATHGRVGSFEFLACGCGFIKHACFVDLHKAIGPNGRHRPIEVIIQPLKDNHGDLIRLKWSGVPAQGTLFE